jgi:excisionase family DNA binding protein
MNDATNQTGDTMGADECAAMLRCTTDVLEDLARRGDIPGLKFGRSWVFFRLDLLAYLAEQAREEAKSRRSKRQPNVTPVGASRRRTPPVLPKFGQ